jgi:HK97 family phage major capsid protein
VKTIADQIKDLENTRAAKLARLNELTQKSISEERSMDEAEGTESDELTADIEQVDKDLVRLRKLEALNVSKARPIVPAEGTDPTKSGTELRGNTPHIIQLDKKLDKGIAFARYVGCMAVGKGSPQEAASFARYRFPNDPMLAKSIELRSRMSGEQIVKAAVDVGTSTDSDWAAPLVNYTVMATDFIEFLRPQTIIGRIPNLRRVPFNIRMPRQTGGGSASWVGEGAPKPLTQLAFDNVTLGYMKLATIAVITEELARFSSPSAEAIVRDTLAKAVIQQMDADFVDPENAGTANVKPASITNGVTPIASAGNSEANVREDIRTIFASWIANNLNPANGVWIMPASTALSLSIMVNTLGQSSFPGISMQGGTFFGLPVVVSENGGLTDSSANGHSVILANASEILVADDGQVTIDVSREASLQMDDAPTNPADANTVFRSLWQTNSIGIKAERFITWTKARSTSVVLMNSVNWGEDLS